MVQQIIPIQDLIFGERKNGDDMVLQKKTKNGVRRKETDGKMPNKITGETEQTENMNRMT